MTELLKWLVSLLGVLAFLALVLFLSFLTNGWFMKIGLVVFVLGGGVVVGRALIFKDI